MNAFVQMKPLTTCERCSVHQRALCGAADPQLQAEFERLSHIRTFRAGETVVGETEEAGFVGNVVSGVLRAQKTMADGRQQIVGLLMPSDMFGRVFARTSQVGIEAATDATLCCIDRHAYEALLARHPELEHRMLLAVLDELDAARDWMLLLGCQSVPERIASFLLILCRRMRNRGCRHGSADGRFILGVPISRRDMAAYLGTTVETISRIVHEMARRRILRIIHPQTFEVLDHARLVDMAGREELDLSETLAGPPADRLYRLPGASRAAQPETGWRKLAG
ncbi:Crp/Fnr family transcriptional regulator [Aquibium sp. A9E412]|uniref:Crp/Fnr family transcriptional regulator n=1 Tax=Aquibium sp. A9E412 TaxID=2976767 RepID=UPI0025B201FE|nr:Crp/Fnr family transcriptional regulator [Aquibium sp. A9E412]MDN2568297.1 Crp/Fnr family transcriptional regulator [Aquibium sp. A9E412]